MCIFFYLISCSTNFDFILFITILLFFIFCLFIHTTAAAKADKPKSSMFKMFSKDAVKEKATEVATKKATEAGMHFVCKCNTFVCACYV